MINVMYSSDDNYLRHAAASICSLLENSNGDDITIHFVSNKLSKKSKSALEKLVTKYNNDDYCINVIDETGKSDIISGRNIVELVESDYILMDFFKPTIKEYLNYCSDLQNRQIEILPTYIYRENGKVTYRYINDWKKEIKLLKTYSPIFENSVES